MSAKKRTASGDPEYSVMALALSAAVADGRLRAVELARLRLMAQISPLFQGVADVDEYLENLAEDFRRSGSERFITRAAASLPESLKPTAFAWAVEMIRADGKVRPSEHRFLARLRSSLGLDGHLAGKIRAVVEIRMRSTRQSRTRKPRAGGAARR